jgi:protein SCO1/2
MNRTISLVVAAVAVVLGVVVIAVSMGAFSDKAPPASSVGGPFTLVDQHGQPATEKLLKGKWSAVFFGYTYCPDICPGTLQALTQASDQLGPRSKDFQIVFISIDPTRDTPQAISAWLEANQAPKNTLGLTGTPAQATAAAKAYKAFAQKQGDGNSYLMNHSTVVYLMDPKGRFVKPLPYNLPDEIARQTISAMRGD